MDILVCVFHWTGWFVCFTGLGGLCVSLDWVVCVFQVTGWFVYFTGLGGLCVSLDWVVWLASGLDELCFY